MKDVLKWASAVGVFTALIALWVPQVSVAQQEEQPELPDLAPHEVEILGQLEISFPALQRQPLVGFNPPPQLPEIPADRRPFVEDYKQESEDLPPSPIQRPEPPGIAGLETYQPARFEVDATAGRYFSRVVRGRLGVPISRTEAFLAHLEHRGLDSYQPFEVEAPFNTFDAGLGFATHQSGFSAGADVGGFLDTYSLFGAFGGRSSTLLLEQPEREGRGIQTSAWIRAVGSTGPDGSARFDYETATYESAFTEEEPTDLLHRSSQRVALDGRIAWPAGGGHRVWAEGEVSHSVLDASSEANETSTGYEAAAGVTLLGGRAMQARLGGRFMGYHRIAAPLATINGPVATRRQSIMPDVRLEFYPGHGALIYAESRPGVEANDLISIFERNPYIVPDPLVLPSLKRIGAEGGGRFYLGPVQLGVRGGYEDYTNLLYFEHAELDDYQFGFSAARYDEAIVIYGGGDLSVSIAQGLQATIGATGRQGRLGDEDDVIPYFGPIVGQAMLSYSFDRSRGLIQLTGTYEASRYRDREKTRKLGDFVDVDLSASYYVAPAFKILFELDNVSPDRLERYDRYVLPSFVARLGAGLRW